MQILQIWLEMSLHNKFAAVITQRAIQTQYITST